ncbi:MAG: hypothetical protein ACYS8X_06340 [Planctomycetota bacterium]
MKWTRLMFSVGLMVALTGCAAQSDTLPTFVNEYEHRGDGLYCYVRPRPINDMCVVRVTVLNGTGGDVLVRKPLKLKGDIWGSKLGASDTLAVPEAAMIDGQERRVIERTLESPDRAVMCRTKSVYMPGKGEEATVSRSSVIASPRGLQEYLRLPSMQHAFPVKHLKYCCQSLFRDIPIPLPDLKDLEYTDVELSWKFYCYGPTDMKGREAHLRHTFRISHVTDTQSKPVRAKHVSP